MSFVQNSTDFSHSCEEDIDTLDKFWTEKKKIEADLAYWESSLEIQLREINRTASMIRLLRSQI